MTDLWNVLDEHNQPALCRFPHHRGSDWVGESGKVFCGVCHPPVSATPQAGGVR